MIKSGSGLPYRAVVALVVMFFFLNQGVNAQLQPLSQTQISRAAEQLIEKLDELGGSARDVSVGGIPILLGDNQFINPAFLEGLRNLAIDLINSRDVIVVEGHTDSSGSSQYNLALGQRYADAVAQALAQLGVPPGRIVTTSFGETRPVAPNDTPEGRALNRRVELKR